MTTNHWPTVALGNVMTQRKDYVEISDLHTYKRCRVQLHAQGIVLRDVVVGAEIKTKKQQVCRAGEFLVAEIDAKVGGFGVVPESLDGAIASSHYFIFALDENVLDRRFLDFYIRTPAFREQVTARGSTNYAAVRPRQVLEYESPLPPLAEQRRIVARIEALAAKIEEALALRQQAAKEAEAMIKAIASHLLARTDGRQLCSVESVCDVRGGIQRSAARAPSASPRRYITVAHVQRNRIDTGDPRYFEVSDDELQRWRLLPGDVLVIEGNGSANQIGRTALFRGEIPDCVHQNHVIRVRPNPQRLLPDYLNAYLNSSPGQDQMIQRSRTTSGLFNLSVGRIKTIEVPLPPLAEQRCVVAYLDGLQAKVDALKRMQAETAAQLDALLPSLLDRAFKGQL
jgi:type I restriction enzyme S subunit